MPDAVDHDSALAELRAFGLALPGVHAKSPWPGHDDLAVNNKTFTYLSTPGEPLSVSCKLPNTAGAALQLPFTSPTGYGLGRSNWVTATFASDDDLPVEMLKAWIDESYRAQAPKKLQKGLPPPRQYPGSR
jgi:predicted DNA-binding protein (MmcQ/YjbR family)